MNSDDLKQIANLLDHKLEEKLRPIQEELKEHGKILKSHSAMLKSLKKDQDTMLHMLDREQMEQKKEIQQIKAHTGLSSSTF